MRRPQGRELARLVAPLAINVGFWLYLITEDVRAVGAAIVLAVVVTVIEANRLCDNLARLPAHTEAVAEAAGVLAPVTDRWYHAPEMAGVLATEPDLCGLFDELEPEFRKLDGRGTRVPAVERRRILHAHHTAAECNCEPVQRGQVATPAHDCPVHGGQS